MDSNLENARPPPSALASLFFKVPKVAELVVYELGVLETIEFLTKIEPAIYNFCKGPGGGLDRLSGISLAGKRRRQYIKRLPDPPRLLAKAWQEKLMHKRLISEEAERSHDVCSNHSPSLSCEFFSQEPPCVPHRLSSMAGSLEWHMLRRYG